MKNIFYVSVFLLFHQCPSQRTFLDNFAGLLRKTNIFLADLAMISKQQTRSRITSKMQERVPESHPFFCDLKDARSGMKPQSVHKLRPGDIDVVAALGDSLTAGIGVTAYNLKEAVIQERGKTFTIGGENDWRSTTTLPNILKVFNPNLVGYSLGDSLLSQKESQLNVAEPAAISADLPYMARDLIKRMTLSSGVNIGEDWKMVTIFMGGNDFCGHICYFTDPFSSLKNHKKDMLTTLRLLRNYLPRTIVNVIPPPNIRILSDLNITDPLCYITHLIECPCFFGVQFAAKRKLLYDVMARWQQLDLEVCNYPEFDTDDFTVVVQPFTLNFTFPTVSKNEADLRYLAPDCFHFSQKMQARSANNLWNTILEPVGNKSLDGEDLFQKFNCPSEEHPYIFTRRNS